MRRGEWRPGAASLLAATLALAACTGAPGPGATTSSAAVSTSTPGSPVAADNTPRVTSPAPVDGASDVALACDHLPLDPLGPSRPELLADMDAAASATVAQLQAAVRDVVQRVPRLVTAGATDLVDAAMASGAVVVADVALVRDGAGVTTLSVDMVLGLPDVAGDVVLRTLAVTDATRPGRPTSLAATIAGAPVDVVLEPGLDRAVVDLGGDSGDGHVLRLAMEAEVPDAATDLVPDRGPASYGLFSDQGGIVALGHWLPVPVAMPGNDGDVPPWGDLGAFAPASWVVDVTMPSGFVQTGGVDLRAVAPDGTAQPGRQVAMGVGLRDLAAVWTTGDEACGPDAPLRRASGSDVLTAWAGPPRSAGAPSETAPDLGTPDADAGDASDAPDTALAGESAAVADLSTRQLEWLAGLLGPLPWPEHDVVRVDMATAAGMEFPGLVMVDTDFWNDHGDTGEYVLVHEWAHQWFHALVGNGSLSDPVVDEPLAQYLSWRWYLDQYGQAVADSVRANAIAAPDPPPADPPGLAAGEFRDHANYSGAVYRVAADAWVTAADEYGVDVVDGIVQSLVDRYALGEGVTEADVVAVANAVDPAVGAHLAAAFSGIG